MSTYEISKSSLLSLKAEILRKQEDLGKAKLENVEKIKTIKKKRPLELKNKGIEERRLNDLDEEEQDLLKLSRSKLEAKAKLYDKLAGNSNHNDEINRKFLVRFDKKDKNDEQPPSDSELGPDLPVEGTDEETHYSDEYDEAVDPYEEWVEYTDCLGRSRRCLRKDLEYLKAKDSKLKPEKVISEKSQNNSQELDEVNNEEMKNTTNLDVQSQIATEESELLSGDMRRDMLRQQWEREEEELRNKTDIHYQNVLFSEARQHGVGYYAFSKDDEERAQQQEALKKLREETEQRQRKAQELKTQREKQMAARMKAARNRRRARLGLPPEEDDPEPTPAPESKQESEEEKKKQEEQKRAEEAETLLIEARKRHVRPWDIGKEGVSEHYEMTQEEWNEKKREERAEEFAPPTSYSTREFSSMQSLENNFEDGDKSLKFSTKNNRKNKNIINQNKSFRENKNYKNNKPSTLRTVPYDYKNEEPFNMPNSYEDDGDSSDRLLQDYKKSQDLSTSPSTAALRGLNPYKNNYYDPIEPTSDNEDNIEPTSDNEDDDNLLRNYNVRKTNVRTIKPTPIINELEEVDFDDRLLADYNRVMHDMSSQEEENLSDDANFRKRGVEVAPPPTFEYYGPGESKRSKSSQATVNIAQSIEVGLKFLRKQADRKGRHCVDENNM